MCRKIKNYIATILRPNGKHDFLSKLNDKDKILDIGCGNHSVREVKRILPECNYFGIDIEEYNISTSDKKLMDNFLLVKPEFFSEEIGKLNKKFDAIICAHNLEHCIHRNKTLIAMLGRLKDGGRIYLSFPCKESISFPHRKGTLNYFDDKTHLYNPPDFDEVIDIINASNFEIVFSVRRYRPILLFLLGLIIEPISIFQKRVYRGTWHFYGFESIIHARKI